MVFHFQMFRCSLIFMITICILLITIPFATPLSFNIPNIRPNNLNNDIKVENGAYISPQGLQLTTIEVGSDWTQKAGRAIYREPLHLWDSGSGELADFNTSFSFVIDSLGRSPYGDGLAFFLAPNNSYFTPGGAFGLPIHPTTIKALAPFVAVEFDTFWNSWDPKNSANYSIGDHVGIDINSLTSVKAKKWWSNISHGGENEAWISYNSTSKNLSVVFTGFRNNTRVGQYGLHYTVDLREVLPEWVNFGFSASTGAYFEKNNVKSWSFCSSNLHVGPLA